MLDSPICYLHLLHWITFNYGLSKNEFSRLALCVLAGGKKSLYIKIALKLAGGDNRDRTGNPQLAKLVLSQLSYIPIFGGPIWNRTRDLCVISTAL